MANKINFRYHFPFECIAMGGWLSQAACVGCERAHWWLSQAACGSVVNGVTGGYHRRRVSVVNGLENACCTRYFSCHW